MLRAVFVIFFFAVCTCSVSGQVPERAQKYFEEAMRQEARREHAEARETMEKAIAAYPGFSDAYSILGTWYFNDHKFGKSAEVFRNAYTGLPRGVKLFSYTLAKSLLYSGRASEAVQVLNNAGTSAETAEWSKLQAQALFVQKSAGQVWKDTVFNMGPAFNTPDAEVFPWVSANERKVYLTRRMNNTDEDFFTAVMDTCDEWYSAQNMGSPPNTANQEAAQMISADGHYLFFHQCENRSANGWGQGGCDLYMAYTADSVWSVPQSFGATINTPSFEGMPCLSPDNRELYFVSNRPGGYGGLDIWVSRFADGLWRMPRNLGPEINTSSDETAPFLHLDNNTIYFSSNGHLGFGGADLFMSQRVNDSTWTKPTNLGAPINTSADENSLCISIDGRHLYFASDRDSVAGNFDLYKMNLPEKLQPVPVNIVKGFVYDSLSKGRVNYASIFVKDIYTDENMYHFNSNRGDGSFMIPLLAGKKYLLFTDGAGYMGGYDTLDLRNQDLKQVCYHNLPLLPSDYIAPVNDSLILTIHFPINSAKLSDSDIAVIKTAMEPWLYNSPGIVIYVNSYTDNTGTPIINEQLSYMRAGLVTTELTAMGINETSIQSKGWGEVNPIASNDTEEGKNMNRRVEVIIRR